PEIRKPQRMASALRVEVHCAIGMDARPGPWKVDTNTEDADDVNGCFEFIGSGLVDPEHLSSWCWPRRLVATPLGQGSLTMLPAAAYVKVVASRTGSVDRTRSPAAS